MNIVFRASAGTGKTHQLTHLYTALVLGEAFSVPDTKARPVEILAATRDPIPPSRLLLMTFTDNAAAELRLRVAQRLLRRRLEAEESGRMEEADRARHALRALPAAPICTFHAFCAGLLREHAIEAGLSPAFSILDEEETGQLLEDAARTELLARLRAGGPEYDPDFAAFCSATRLFGGLRASGVAGTAQALVRQAAGLGLSLESAESWLPPPSPTASLEQLLDLLAEFHRVRADRGKPLPGRAHEVFQCLEKMAKNFPTIGKSKADFSNHWKISDSLAVADDLTRQCSISFTGEGGRLNALSTRLREWVASARNDALYERRSPAMRAFVRYAAAVERGVTARQQQLQGLAFDDLLRRARDLLATRKDRARLYDVILLDEAQDTSRLQCELLRLLWDPTSGSLVLCGDVKQSIYAWRNADPKVMPDLEELMRPAPGYRPVALRDSYRSKDQVLRFVNLLFPQVYGPEYSAEDQLAPVESRNALVAGQGEGPCFEELLPAGGGTESESPAPDRAVRVRNEMDAVARRIRLLVEGPSDEQPKFRFSEEAQRFEPVGEGHRFRYGDILVLLRRTTNQPALEHALRRYRIPYRVGGRGQGLYSRPEAKDLLLLWQVLTRPCETIPLIGFLRSPWVGLTDEALMLLGWGQGEFDEALFHRRVLGGAPLPEEWPPSERDLLEDGRALLRVYRPQVDRRSTAELTREIVAQTGYDAVLAGSFRGSQRLANLRRLFAELERMERHGALAAEVCDDLEAQIEEPPDIPEAELLDPDQDAVELMTIHGAKGLTQRVVFVPELDARPSGAEPWALLAGAGNLQLRSELLDRTPVRTPGFEAARGANRAVRDAEARNVFYVALTRARDLVVLSGQQDDPPEGTWRHAIEELRRNQPGKTAECLRLRTFDDVARAAEAAGIQPVVAAAVVPPEKGFRPAAFFEAANRYPLPLKTPVILRHSATTLSAFACDPSAFAPAPAPPGEEAFARETDDRAARFGTAGHEAMEQLYYGNWTVAPVDVLPACPSAAGLSPEERTDLVARLERAVQFMARWTAGARNGAAEWPFALRLDYGGTTLIVDGTVDALCRRDGLAALLDYKFTEEPPEQLAARYGLQLNLYRAAAARRWSEKPEAVQAVLLALGRDRAQAIEVTWDPQTVELAMHAARALYAAPATSPPAPAGSPR